ncbi:MAG: DUF2868 domain-containing protein [Casimicrobiaceae bacterium]
MDEFAAASVVAVRAVETGESARTLWSDEDRAWASRAAAEVVGADSSAEIFLARRAQLASEKVGARHPAFARSVQALRWRPWVATAVVTCAFALGFFLDQVGHAQRINILAPPVLGLLLWNVIVYLAIIAGYVMRYGEDSRRGPLRGALIRVAGAWSRSRPRPSAGGAALRNTMLAFVGDWARCATPLYGVRAARILHLAAASLAVGVIAGLYVRGLAFEYRATWESTFIDAPTVRAITAFAYAPGAWVTALQVPGVDAVASIRTPAAENAARWVHLMAATVFVVVVLPRLLLALVAWLIESYRARHLPLALDEPYFQRLLRGYRGAVARVRVIPFSYTPAPAALAALEALMARVFGDNSSLTLAAPVGYAAEEVPFAGAAAAGTAIVVLFNANTTPEREVHGVFLARLAAQHAGAESLLALVDESAFLHRWRDEPARISDRRAAWREIGDIARAPMVFVDLAASDLVVAATAIDDAIAMT